MASGLTGSARSARGLDLLNFFVANIQTGFGPFIAVYLSAQAWTEFEIGMALSVGTFTAMVSQLPAGALVDATPRKKLAALVAILCMPVSALLLVAVEPRQLPVMLSEVGSLTRSRERASITVTGRRQLDGRGGCGPVAKKERNREVVGASLFGSVAWRLP